MLETNDLILDKAKFSDWEAIYRNVWSHAETARYMMWQVTATREDAKKRIQKTIDFQKTHDAYFVYDKRSGEAIGFAGIKQIEPQKYEETGICLGPAFVGKGYGKQILLCLLQYCRDTLGGKEFLYFTRDENKASIGLARSLGFQLMGTEEKTDERNGQAYILQQYILKL